MVLETLILIHPNEVSLLADSLVFHCGGRRPLVSLGSLILKHTLGVLCREKL